MPQARGVVSGAHQDKHVVFYGLSTCIWCKRTRQFLEDQDVAFEYAYVDLLQGSEKEEAMAQVRRWNAVVSFPTIVVDDTVSVVGYRPEEIKEALGL